jgi:uncharacterized protein (DUF3820 family)
MIIPFGKHKGEHICDLDDDYLVWLKKNVDLYGEVKEEVDQELIARNLEVE